MSSKEIRKKFLEYFKKQGHIIVPSSSLIPDDPSVLLTTAGMQQFKPYYAELDSEITIHPNFRKPVEKNAASVQKCFRTSDIDEVGDESHLTFFEMLGNFSFGGYFKKEAIKYGNDFITKEMELEIEYVTVFDPDKVDASDWRKGVPFDKNSYDFWKEIAPEVEIRKEGVDNFWGPTGSEGPCGPTTEIYVNTELRKTQGKPPLEIWNIVFNEFYRDKDFKLKKLEKPGIDTGMGLERLTMVKQNVPTIFGTDLFREPFKYLRMGDKHERIIADHIRGSVFLLADGVRPSNKEAGYMLRRLIRRAMTHSQKASSSENSLLIPKNILMEFVSNTIEYYGDFYVELNKSKTEIIGAFEQEFDKFNLTLQRGLREFDRRWPGMQVHEYILGKGMEFFVLGQQVGSEAFDLLQSYGFPVEVIKELLQERLYQFNEAEFEEFEKGFEASLSEKKGEHLRVSSLGQEKKFGGHGLILDTGELKAGNEEELKKVTRLHTATHLLQQALRDVLGSEVRQMGSDITIERTRFDFTFPRKMTDEEKRKVEEIVNEKIRMDLPVGFVQMPFEEAKKTGALHFFKQKYPDVVNVYYVGKSLNEAYSKELCGGPHVTHTGEIGKFRIAKEESSSAGVRRIRGVVE